MADVWENTVIGSCTELRLAQPVVGAQQGSLTNTELCNRIPTHRVRVRVNYIQRELHTCLS